nr:hypothetical protein [Tanacetum cinerariifolium]
MVPYEAFAYCCGARDVVMRESYKPKTRGNYTMHVHDQRGTSPSTGQFSWSFNDSSYSPGSSTPSSYSPGPSTPPSYSLGPSKNAECSNCKLLLGKIK